MCIRCTFKREPNLYKPCGFVLGFLVSDANPVSCTGCPKKNENY